MRKFALFSILMVVMVGFVACEKSGTDSGEPLYPSPEAVVVNDDDCGENSIALIFDGRAAIKAGAESFTSNLEPADAGDIISITQEVNHPDACNPVFRNIPAGVYTASVYASYPDGTSTAPVFATDSKGAVVKLKIEGAAVAVKLAYATSSSLAFTWSVSGFRDVAKDCATAYSFGIYKDAECKDLIVSWQTEANHSIWDKNLADGSPQFEFSGLERDTFYWFAVKNLNNKAESAPVKAKTLDFDIVVPNAEEPVEAGGIAIAEDFSELVWGGNYLCGSAAYSADDRNLATALDKAEGVNPVNGGSWKWYLVGPTIEMGLFNTLKHAVEHSRLGQWGVCPETDGGSNATVCGRVAHLKLGASNQIGLICTPPLTNLKSVATVELQFDQARYDSDPTTGAVYLLNDSEHSGKSGGYRVSPSFQNLAPAAEFEIEAGRTFTTEKIVVRNVVPGARIAIGPIRKDGSTPGSSQHRMYLDNVIVKVVAYELSGVSLDKPVIVSADATVDEIAVKWSKIENASGYVLEYKENDAGQYTAVELENVQEYTIKELNASTVYQIRIKAVEKVSKSESEYSDIKSVKTLVKAKFPMIAGTADEFIEILNDADGLRTATATDEIQIVDNLDFAGKTLPDGVVFPGTLNGNNFTVCNIVSDHALFASITNARNLTIDESCTFTSDKAVALAALAVEATGVISNVVNRAAVSVSMTGAADAIVTVSGIVAINSAKLDACKNYGTVTYTSSAAVSCGALAAGLAAYSDGAIDRCENHGNVTLSVPYLSGLGSVKGFEDVPMHIGGLAAHLGENAPITDSVNDGDIDYDITAFENQSLSCTSNRPRMGGIVGLAYSDIISCRNNGKIDVCVATSDKSVSKSSNYPINVGGISGGAFAGVSGASCSDIKDCINNGEINFITYCDGAIPTCGGIVGYPGYEHSSQTNLITGCVNNGTINVFAQDEIRIGGISGGTGNVTYCKNYGAIKGTVPYEDATIGGISGFLSQKHKFEYNESYGLLSNINGSKKVVEIGGLVGQHGGVDSREGEGRGCIVNCDIVYDWGNHKWYGLTIGWNYNNKAVVVMGTEDEPVRILGGSISCDGGKTVIPITADNYETYAKGSGSEPYTVHVKFGN